jgi:hypothetical protein
MLSITPELIEILQSTNAQDSSIIDAYIRAIRQRGSAKDAQALFNFFLKNPSDYYSGYLLPIFAQFGNQNTAKTLMELCFVNETLQAGIHEDVLHVLGRLGFVPALPILRKYAFEIEDYYLSRSAILGLLHLDCQKFENQIIAEIEKTYNQNLFNEFVPSLVCKVQKPTGILQKLYQLGNTVCSTDCNAGIILGFALSGRAGEAYFRQILFDPYWETYSSGTGTVYWTYIGVVSLGIHFADLYQVIKKNSTKIDLAYHLEVLYHLLNTKINAQGIFPLKFIDLSQMESYISIYRQLFQWENPNQRNNIIDLAKTVNLHEKYYELEHLITHKIGEELILKTLK